MKPTFLLLAAAIAFLPDLAWSQNAQAIRRIGVLQVGSPTPVAPIPANPFTSSLAKHGYVEGKNLVVERRWGEYEQLPALASELQRQKVEVIGVWGTQGARIVQNVVKSTPLVIYSCDPFEHVTKLARPSGNVTGTTCMTTELSQKRLGLLRELLPRAKRVVFFGDPEDAPEGWRLSQEASKQLGFAIQMIPYKGRDGIPEALKRVAEARPDAVFVYPDAILGSERGKLAQFWLQHSLPSMNAFPEFSDAGALMSYGAVYTETFAILGSQVAKILDGARPGDVPVQRATRFDLVINLKTAKALGVKVPKSLLLRADRIIE